LAPEPAGDERRANVTLIAIGAGGVDVAIPDTKRMKDGLLRLLTGGRLIDP